MNALYVLLLTAIFLYSCRINHSKLIMQDSSCMSHLHLNKGQNRKTLNSKIDSVLNAVNYKQKEYGGCQCDDSTTQVKYIIRNEAGEKIGAYNLLIEDITKVKYKGQSFTVY